MSRSAFLGMDWVSSKVRVFASYDREHDHDLLDQLVREASSAASGFEVSGRSTAWSPNDPWDERLRRAIREADQVIVICGEQTAGSERVDTELHIAREEGRPYFLLWGRRESMCTKPTTARPKDGMYSWTPEILRTQILTRRRLAESNERLSELSRAAAQAKR